MPPVAVVKGKKQEEWWDEAKTSARKKFGQKSNRFWKYTMGTFQNRKRNAEREREDGQ